MTIKPQITKPAINFLSIQSLFVTDPTRKDPFASSKNGNQATNHQDADGTIYGQAIQKTAGNSSTTIGVNIQNPHTFYTGTNPNSTPYYNSWSARNKDVWSGETSTDNVVIKTIYDPCPVGYTAPPANAFSNFTTANWDSTNKGHTFSGCWVPALGYRVNNTGALINVGGQGFYWQAVPASATNARNLSFNGNSNVTPAYAADRSYGFPVRPVKEID